MHLFEDVIAAHQDLRWLIEVRGDRLVQMTQMPGWISDDRAAAETMGEIKCSRDVLGIIKLVHCEMRHFDEDTIDTELRPAVRIRHARKNNDDVHIG
ncbi:MAG TPA: hypothetical protein VL282_06640 [Tepidisphaeraceae bacterium]|nr:hypothetical protein [Tepidisphaeraceae bacterium]